MFLRDLDDKYKKPFLNLAYTIMSADGEFAEKEKVMLGIYKHQPHNSVSSIAHL